MPWAGGRWGGLANLLSAHRDLANPAHRAEVAALWGVPEVPATPGRTAVEMFQAAADGEIRALWIACTNPAQSLPDQATVRRALERAEFVVVQEAFSTTATCAYADLLLPATTWGEKTGTVTNSERRISRVRPAVPAPGQARHDWAIAVEFARRLQDRLRPQGASLFPYDTGGAEAGAEAIWNEHRETTRGRDLDITGLSWALIDMQGPQHWPFPEGAAQGRARLYEDGVFPTPDGRARFAAAPWKPVAEPRSAPLSVQPHHRPPARPVARHEPHRHPGPPLRPHARTPACSCTRRTWSAAGSPKASWCGWKAGGARSSCPCRPAPTWGSRRPSSPCTGAVKCSAATPARRTASQTARTHRRPPWA